MYVKDIFAAVQEEAPCSQSKFLAFLHATVQYLLTKYREKYVVGKSVYVKPVTLDTDIAVDERYFGAICSNIVYLLTQNENKKVDFTAEAEYAYRSVWTDAHEKARFLARGYYDV